MNVGLEQVADCGIDHAMTCQRRDAAERLRHYAHAEMAETLRGPGVARVEMPLVLDHEDRGRKTLLQASPQPLLATCHDTGH